MEKWEECTATDLNRALPRPPKPPMNPPETSSVPRVVVELDHQTLPGALASTKASFCRSTYTHPWGTLGFTFRLVKI
eukprot:1196233-Prorocentrum_minimum.AAC.1